MDKLLDSPWFLRFTALFFALLMFFSTQSENDGTNSKTVGDQLDTIRDVPVEVYYDNENLIVTGVPETVNVTIEGPVNIVQTTKMLKDFTLFVDLRTLTMGEHHVRIQDENISEKLDVRIDPSTIDILIEERITETFRVDPELNERLLAEAFYVESMEVNPSTIEVTGAKSVIESISFVKATVSSKEGINKSFEQQASVRVLDKDLNKLNIEIVPEHVMIKVEVAENSKEVPIVLKARGTPPADVVIDSLTSETKVVTLFGPSKVLDEIDELSVDVDVSGVKASGKIEVDLKKPKGVSSLSATKVKVNIEGTAADPGNDDEAASSDSSDDLKEDVVEESPTENSPQEQETTVGTLKFENIQVVVKGLDQKFKSTLLKPVAGLLTLTVTAKSDVLDTLNKSDFTVSIDLSGIDAEGEHTIPLLVEGPPDIRWTLSDNEATLRIELA